MSKSKNILPFCGVLFLFLIVINIFRAGASFETAFEQEFDDAVIRYCLYGVGDIICIIGCALTAYSCFSANRRFLCISYFGIYTVIPGLFYFLGNTISYFIYPPRDIVSALVSILSGFLPECGTVLIGLFFLKFTEESGYTSKKAKAVAPVAPVINTSEQIARLEKLHSLLDIGAITPEEFEAKKKEILGL